ncbi:MAG: hypothetical protein IPJ77_06975 [Planctomycetes bacterium]|nr:hypothetical protein [Planctomycetota bacterium]
MKPAFLLAGALLFASCVSFRFDRATVNGPPRKQTVAAMAPGKTSLAEALKTLGAPLLAWEWKGDGMALAWGWSEDGVRGISVSVPLDQGGSAQASYDELARHLRGVVLFFDADGGLVDVREGALNDFREARRRRPAPVEASAAPAR